jgi:hypothetical protein
MAGDVNPTVDTTVDTKQEGCNNGNDQKKYKNVGNDSRGSVKSLFGKVDAHYDSHEDNSKRVIKNSYNTNVSSCKEDIIAQMYVGLQNRKLSGTISDEDDEILRKLSIMMPKLTYKWACDELGLKYDPSLPIQGNPPRRVIMGRDENSN